MKPKPTGIRYYHCPICNSDLHFVTACPMVLDGDSSMPSDDGVFADA